MYKKRTIEKYVKTSIGSFPIIMITGARQVGKTTMLNYINDKEKVNFVTLDDLRLRTLANDDPELFLRTYEPPLVIDEFQYAPPLLPYIKIIVDNARKDALKNNKEVGTLYYLTGSQVFETESSVSESLAGRVAIFDMHGFSRREIEGLNEEIFIPDIDVLKKKEKTKYVGTQKLFEMIINGSYPDLNTNKKIDRETFYRSYLNTYIERDIRKLINVKNESKFYKFICTLASKTSEEYNVSEIAKKIGVDVKTISYWTNILVEHHLVYLLQPYFNNDLKRIIKRPKLYFMDTGLACYLAGYYESEILEKSTYSGNIFETYVISEIIKSYTNNGKDTRLKLFYYRDDQKKEIDLIIINNNKLYPVEIKKNSNPSAYAIKNFDVVDKFNIEKGNGIVLCLTKDIGIINENNYYVPIEYI